MDVEALKVTVNLNDGCILYTCIYIYIKAMLCIYNVK